MPTAEQLMAKLYELRKDYQGDDEPDNEHHYQALHCHAFLFISYNLEAFRKYLPGGSEERQEELTLSGSRPAVALPARSHALCSIDNRASQRRPGMVST